MLFHVAFGKMFKARAWAWAYAFAPARFVCRRSECGRHQLNTVINDDLTGVGLS
jgi:hypothetical protein